VTNLRKLGERHAALLPRRTLDDLGGVSLTGSSGCPRRSQFQANHRKKKKQSDVFVTLETTLTGR